MINAEKNKTENELVINFSEELRNSFLRIVCLQMKDRGYGYTSLATMVIAEAGSDLANQVMLANKLKKLRHEGRIIKDEKILNWLWRFFLTLEKWKPILRKLSGENDLLKLAKDLDCNFNYSFIKEAQDSEYDYQLEHNIGDGKFVRISSETQITYEFIFLKKTASHTIYEVILSFVRHSDLFSSNETDYKLDRYSKGYFIRLMPDEGLGLLLTSRDLRNVVLKTSLIQSLSNDKKTNSNPVGKVINPSSHRMAMDYEHENYEKMMDVINDPLNIHQPENPDKPTHLLRHDPYLEFLYRVQDERRLLQDNEILGFDTHVYFLDNLKSEML